MKAAFYLIIFLSIIKLINCVPFQQGIVIENKGKNRVSLLCGPKGQTGDKKFAALLPNRSAEFNFNRDIHFACTLERNGHKLTWIVFDEQWPGVPKIAKWQIRNDGVYDWNNKKR